MVDSPELVECYTKQLIEVVIAGDITLAERQVIVLFAQLLGDIDIDISDDDFSPGFR